MKISIIGTGYVGLSTAVGFAKKGHEVICMDVDKKKIEMIGKGESPIYEPGVNDELPNQLVSKKIKPTTDLSYAVNNSDISFICVPTPSKANGSMDTRFIEKVAQQIGEILKEKQGYHVIVVKSTVVPGTTKGVVIPNIEKYSGKSMGHYIGVCVNPEFLREGKALEDFMEPDRIVIGEADSKAGDVLEELYSSFGSPILRFDTMTAEMIKYASNAFLAAKISYSNEIGNLCKELGIDTYNVMKGVGMDFRISPHFLASGIGFGGSCFPKDVKALISRADEMKHDMPILKDVITTNEKQPMRVLEILKRQLESFDGKKITVLGLSFKPDTDDIREAPSIKIVRSLVSKGAIVNAYDPQAMENFKEIFPNIEYFGSAKDALRGADACIILTEWEEFGGLNDMDFSLMKSKIIVEGRRILNPTMVSGFEGICW